MKAKKRTKAIPTSRSKTRAKSRTNRPKKAHHSSTKEFNASSAPNLSANVVLKTCQELEVGDIGGFGSPEELVEHERRCNEQATEFCGNCGKNLCQNHYDLIHRDHDHSMQSSPVSQA